MDAEGRRGLDGYPILNATHVALDTTRRFLQKDHSVCRFMWTEGEGEGEAG